MKKLIAIPALFYGAASLFAADYTINENITNPASSVSATAGDTVQIQNSISVSGGGYIEASGASIPVDMAAGTTVSVEEGSHFSVSGTSENLAALTLLGTSTREGFTVSGEGSETAGKVQITNAYLYTYNATNSDTNIPTFTASGYGKILLDNVQNVSLSEQTYYNYNYKITLSDSSNFTLNNASVLGNTAYRNSAFTLITVKNNATLDILGGSKLYHYRWASINSPIAVSENGKINISGTGSQLYFTSSGNTNPVNLSGSGQINISDGGAFYAHNVVAVNAAGSSQININDGGEFYIRQTSQINLSDTAQINLRGTGRITGVGVYNLSGDSSINSYGTGTVSGTLNLSGNAQYNIVDSEAASVMGVSSMSGNSSLNIINSTATTSGNITIGSDAEGSNVSMNIGSGSMLQIANNNSVFAGENGAISASGATIQFNGLNSRIGATEGSLTVEDSVLNMTFTNWSTNPNIYGAGNGSILIKDSQITNAANNWWALNITLEDNSSLVLDNTIANYKLNTQVNRGRNTYTLSDNATMTLQNGTVFRPYQYSSDSKVDLGGSSVLTVKDSGTSFWLNGSHGTACNIYVYVKENANFVVADSATFTTSDGVLNLNVAENGKFTLKNGATATYTSGTAKYNFDGGESGVAVFELAGTGITTKISTLDMSEKSKLAFVASESGISTLSANSIGSFAATLEIDFSKILLDEGEYSFNLINSASVPGTMLDYTGGEAQLEGLVNVIKRGADDAWEIDIDGNNLVFYYTAAVIPEPATFAGIFGLAALGAAILRRRRK